MLKKYTPAARLDTSNTSFNSLDTYCLNIDPWAL